MRENPPAKPINDTIRPKRKQYYLPQSPGKGREGKGRRVCRDDSGTPAALRKPLKAAERDNQKLMDSTCRGENV